MGTEKELQPQNIQYGRKFVACGEYLISCSLLAKRKLLK